jgi:hypothetical protein
MNQRKDIPFGFAYYVLHEVYVVVKGKPDAHEGENDIDRRAETVSSRASSVG